MSDIDLTEAVEAAARDRAERQNGPGWWATADGYVKHVWREGVYQEVTAALPHIQRQVREQVAEEINEDRDLYARIETLCEQIDNPSILADKIQDVIAARIARGDS